MCNLNVLITKKPSYEDYGLLMERLTTLSYESNSDADGVYFSGTDKVIKSSFKLDYTSFVDEFLSSKFVISHQRFTTSGYDESNHQPIENKEFVIAHNGVLSRRGNDNTSDTVEMFKDFEKSLAKNIKETTGNRETSMIATIREIFANEYGSFSICLYDKVDEVMYYFKNSNTTIYGLHSDEYMFLSTRDTSFWHKEKLKEFSIKALAIYKVTADTLAFKKIADIEQYGLYEYDEMGSYSKHYKKKYKHHSHNLKETISDEEQGDFEGYSRFWGYCDDCGNQCMVSEKSRYNYDILCKECYAFRREYEFMKGEPVKTHEMTDKEWEEYNAKYTRDMEY